MLNRSATNTRIARKSASKPSPLNRWRRHNALKLSDTRGSSLRRIFIEERGRRWGGWERSVATSVGRKPLGNRVPDEDKNSVEFARAAAGKLERKGARVWLPPVSARFCLREFHPANRAPRPPPPFHPSQYYCWEVVARFLRHLEPNGTVNRVFQVDITELCPSATVLAQQLTHVELERLSYIGPEEFVQAFAKVCILCVCVCTCVCFLFQSRSRWLYIPCFLSFLRFEDVDW